MAKPTRKGKAPAAKKSAVAEAAEVLGEAMTVGTLATAKLTVSVKRRLANGDEVFIAPGVEMQCTADELGATQEAVEQRVNSWMEALLETYPDVELDDEADVEDEDEDEDEADVEDEDEADEDEEDGLTEEDVAKMKLADLKALIKDEELETDPKGLKLKELREAIIDELFGDEGEVDDEDEDEDEDDEADVEDEDEDEADEDGYTKEELSAMKLADLQEVCEAWELDHPKIAKGANMAAKKKAYVKHILAAQEEDE